MRKLTRTAVAASSPHDEPLVYFAHQPFAHRQVTESPQAVLERSDVVAHLPHVLVTLGLVPGSDTRPASKAYKSRTAACVPSILDDSTASRRMKGRIRMSGFVIVRPSPASSPTPGPPGERYRQLAVKAQGRRQGMRDECAYVVPSKTSDTQVPGEQTQRRALAPSRPGLRRATGTADLCTHGVTGVSRNECPQHIEVPGGSTTGSGAGDGIRTRDNLLGRQELYH